METSIQAVNPNAVHAAEPAASCPAASGPLALWHLLSLDAPSVAAVWTWFIARTAHVELPAVVPVGMFLAVWLVYSADRVMDTMGDTDEPLEQRHHFHREHRRGFQLGILGGAVALVALMVAMPPALLLRYAGLALLLVAWFGWLHVLPRPRAGHLPKELVPGAFFAAAVVLPCVGSANAGEVVAAAFFGLVCVLNCLYIFAWEHAGERTGAHATTQIGVRLLLPLTLGCAVGPFVMMFVAPRLAPVWVAISSAAVLLFALDRMQARIERTNLRAAADLMLLTPLLVLPFVR